MSKSILIPDLSPPQEGPLFDDNISGLNSVILQVLFTLLLAGALYLCSSDWTSIIRRLCPSFSTQIRTKPIRKDFTGYRNYDPKIHDNIEPLYPGNPSDWYESAHVPYFRRAVLNEKHGVSENNTKKQYYIALGGKVFDVSDGSLSGILNNSNGVKLPLLYGKDLSLAASKGVYDNDTLNKPLNPDNLTQHERLQFYTTYNAVYVNYPIVGTFEDEGIYVKLLKNRMAFQKSRFFS